MKERKLKEFAKLTKIEFLGISGLAVIGALTVKGNSLEISHFLILFLMGLLSFIFVFVHNDYKDIKIDKLSKKPRVLVQGTISSKSAFIIILISVIINLLLTLIFFGRFFPLSIMITSLCLGGLYNRYSKKIRGADLFLSGSMASLCLFGAVAVADDILFLKDINNLTWIAAALVFFHVLFMNVVEGGLKDAEEDRKAGAKTIAVNLGVKTFEKMIVPASFKLIGVLIKIVFAVLIFIPFLLLDLKFELWQIILLIVLVLGMFRSIIKLLNMPIFNGDKRRRYTGRQEMTSYTLILIMLMGFIGEPWTLFMILFPVLWFLFFSFIIHGKKMFIFHERY